MGLHRVWSDLKHHCRHLYVDHTALCFGLCVFRNSSVLSALLRPIKAWDVLPVHILEDWPSCFSPLARGSFQQR